MFMDSSVRKVFDLILNKNLLNYTLLTFNLRKNAKRMKMKILLRKVNKHQRYLRIYIIIFCLPHLEPIRGI
jgi:hypothetical protein